MLDELVKNITQALAENDNMLADTLIIYTADNGGPIQQVRKTPSWPRCWANFSLL